MPAELASGLDCFAALAMTVGFFLDHWFFCRVLMLLLIWCNVLLQGIGVDQQKENRYWGAR